MRHIIARNAADGGYTKKFVARNVAEVGRDSTAAILRAILRATNFRVDARCNSAIVRNIARNIAPCIRTFILKLDRNTVHVFYFLNIDGVFKTM